MLAWPQAGAMKGFEIAWKTGRASIRVAWASRAGKPVSETSPGWASSMKRSAAATAMSA